MSTYARLRDLFRTGWRPALGWTMVLAVLHEFVLRHWLTFPGGDAAQLVALVTMGLGAAGLRGWEKTKGME